MLYENNIFMVKDDDSNRRIDRVLRKFLKNQTLSKIYSALRKGKIKVNGKKIRQNYITQNGDKIEIFDNFSLQSIPENKNFSVLQFADIKPPKPDIILKTEHFLFINKKQGEIIHGTNSISEQVLYHHNHKTESLSFVPGPLHRLDKDTTGIVTFSQSLKAAQEFSLAMQTNKIHKYYFGVIEGISIKSVLKSNISGKKCLTYTKLISVNKEKNISLVEFKLVTGRKHQIRIQCKDEGVPLLYDTKYNNKFSITNNFKKTIKHIPRYFLHSKKLEFSKELLDSSVFKSLPSFIEAELPKCFKKFIKENFRITDL